MRMPNRMENSNERTPEAYKAKMDDFLELAAQERVYGETPLTKAEMDRMAAGAMTVLAHFVNHADKGDKEELAGEINGMTHSHLAVLLGTAVSLLKMYAKDV